MENSQSANGLGSDKENNQQKHNQQVELPVKEINKTIAKPSLSDAEENVQKEQPEQIKHHNYINPEVFIQKKNPTASRGQTENMNYGKSEKSK